MTTFFAVCALVIVMTRWGYAFVVPPHTPIYANFDIGFQYLYADYFRDYATFPGGPADISQGAENGYFWWWWDNEYFSKYMGFAAAVVGVFLWIGVPFVPAYAIVTWVADMSIAVLAYRLVAAAAGRRAGIVAALLVAVHPLFVWGMYQAQVQLSVGVALFLGVVACWRSWSDRGRWWAPCLAAGFALAASLSHAFFLSMLLGAFLPAVALHTLMFQRTRREIGRQIVFALAVTLGLFANTRLWFNFETYSGATKSLIGRTDAWGQLPSPLFMIGLTSRANSWHVGPEWLAFGGFMAALLFAVARAVRARDLEGHSRAIAFVFGVSFLLDLAYMIGAHQIHYDYWILRHAQFHIVAAILPVSVGLGWLMQSRRRVLKVGAWAIAGGIGVTCLAVSIDQMLVKRSYGPAFAEFIAEEHRPKLPYVVVLYPGGTALTPFTCALTETPAYDLHSDTMPHLREHLERHYGWKPGDDINVLWYSAVSRISREDVHFTEVFGEWSAGGESVVIGKARVDLGHAEPAAPPGDGWALIDSITFDDPSSETAHGYRVNAPVFNGTTIFARQSEDKVYIKSGRATKSFEEFRLKVAPGSEHALVKGFDTMSARQVARVVVDGGPALQWNVGGGRERYAESSLGIPASIIGNRDEVTLRVEYVDGSRGINSYGYWMYARPADGIARPLRTDTEGYVLTDRLDVGNTGDEAAHQYEISEPTFTGQQLFMLPDKGASYRETGRATKIGEKFRVRATRGREHLLIKVYDNFSRDQRVRVSVDGTPAGIWELPTQEARYGEAGFVIPGSLIHGDEATIEVQFLSGSLDQNSFVYWMYAKAPLGQNESESQAGAEEARAIHSLRP